MSLVSQSIESNIFEGANNAEKLSSTMLVHAQQWPKSLHPDSNSLLGSQFYRNGKRLFFWKWLDLTMRLYNNGMNSKQHETLQALCFLCAPMAISSGSLNFVIVQAGWVCLGRDSTG